MSIKAINWARAVCIRLKVPSRHRLALFMICLHHHDKTGDCFPSYDTIADACGYSRRKVIDLIADLEANGLIIKQKRRVAGHQGSNQFVLFGCPKALEWIIPRVHKKAPCEGAETGTQPRVQTGAPDRNWVSNYATSARNLRVVGGGD